MLVDWLEAIAEALEERQQEVKTATDKDIISMVEAARIVGYNNKDIVDWLQMLIAEKSSLVKGYGGTYESVNSAVKRIAKKNGSI